MFKWMDGWMVGWVNEEQMDRSDWMDGTKDLWMNG